MDGGAHEQRDDEEDAGEAEAAEPPAECRQTGDEAAEDEQVLRMFRLLESPRPWSYRPVGLVGQSARGQSSRSGASQRLVQWIDATFWIGTRMWPFSSMWTTSSTRQYAVRSPS